jgi:hypothetical protein
MTAWGHGCVFCDSGGCVTSRQNFVYMILPYYPAADLHERVIREPGGCLPEHAARRYFVQILVGIEEMQRHGVVHRYGCPCFWHSFCVLLQVTWCVPLMASDDRLCACFRLGHIASYPQER